MGGGGGGFPGHLRRLETQLLEADGRTPSPDRRLPVSVSLSRTEGRYPQRRLDPVDSAADPEPPLPFIRAEHSQRLFDLHTQRK